MARKQPQRLPRPTVIGTPSGPLARPVAPWPTWPHASPPQGLQDRQRALCWLQAARRLPGGGTGSDAPPQQHRPSRRPHQP